MVDALSNPVGFFLTGGEAHDLVGADHLLPDMRAETLIADEAFDADERVIAPLAAAGKTAVIPPKANRTLPRDGIVRLTGLVRPGRRGPGWRDEQATRPALSPRHRFPAELISHAVWLYHVFSLSFRDVELLLAERGIIVSYESVRQWCLKFGASFADKMRRRRPARRQMVPR